MHIGLDTWTNWLLLIVLNAHLYNALYRGFFVWMCGGFMIIQIYYSLLILISLSNYNHYYCSLAHSNRLHSFSFFWFSWFSFDFQWNTESTLSVSAIDPLIKLFSNVLIPKRYNKLNWGIISKEQTKFTEYVSTVTSFSGCSTTAFIRCHSFWIVSRKCIDLSWEWNGYGTNEWLREQISIEVEKASKHQRCLLYLQIMSPPQATIGKKCLLFYGRWLRTKSIGMVHTKSTICHRQHGSHHHLPLPPPTQIICTKFVRHFFCQVGKQVNLQTC